MCIWASCRLKWPYIHVKASNIIDNIWVYISNIYHHATSFFEDLTTHSFSFSYLHILHELIAWLLHATPLLFSFIVFFKIPSVSQRRCAFEMKGSGYYIWQLFLSIRINGLMFQNFLSMKCLAYVASLRMWYAPQQTDFRDIMVIYFVCINSLIKLMLFYEFKINVAYMLL